MEQIDTPEKVKEYLTEESIHYAADATDGWLYTLAKRRLKRRLFEAGDESLKRNCNVDFDMSLTDLVAAMTRLKAKAEASGGKEQLWPTVRFHIVDFADPSVVRLKHFLDSNDGCTGNIIDGQCKRCHNGVFGVHGYSFKVLAADVNNPARTLGIQFSHKGGRTLFKTSATAWNATPQSTQADKMEAVEGVAVVAKLIVTYDPADEEFFVCAFSADVI